MSIMREIYLLFCLNVKEAVVKVFEDKISAIFEKYPSIFNNIGCLMSFFSWKFKDYKCVYFTTLIIKIIKLFLKTQKSNTNLFYDAFTVVTN